MIKALKKLLSSIGRIKIDEESWIECCGPSEYNYCEDAQGEKVGFDCIRRNRKSVTLRISTHYSHPKKGIGDPVSEANLHVIAAKLKKHYESEKLEVNLEFVDATKMVAVRPAP